ncbi:unnamed protein product [Meganyctiphanes norvegica]|uniref:Protein FMC1 homolog n=1 Tax=Meganyctiphanes norvegica TaxID=48144 RepID=A0AAV2QUJ0_MEGNR
MASSLSKVRTLRSLIRELRNAVPEHERVKHSPSFSFLMEQYRRNSLTDQQYCREAEEMAYMADTYATYLESSRKQQELYYQYHAAGERSIRETADMVGFKLPNDPK